MRLSVVLAMVFVLLPLVSFPSVNNSEVSVNPIANGAATTDSTRWGEWHQSQIIRKNAQEDSNVETGLKRSTTYVVAPDGSGDFLTIQAAINAASSGDIVELQDGIFRGNGNQDLDFHGKAIQVRSASGNPEVCIIDCELLGIGFLFQNQEGPASVVSGITITRGAGGSPGGGGIRCYDNSSPTIENCILRQNTSDTGGGMICHSGSSPTIRECVFFDNHPLRGGGLSCYHSSSPHILNCTFVFNSAQRKSYGGAIYLLDSSSPIIENTIIAFNLDEAVYGSGTNIPSLSCCDVFENQGGDWVGPIADQLGIRGNISEDPILCNPAVGEFSLDQSSPCASENNPECGQIGALPVGCGEDPTIPIGDIQYYDPITGIPMSPYENQVVTSMGIVYAVKGTLTAGGYYIQDETGGINYYAPLGEGIALGDIIRVTAPVFSYAGELYLHDSDAPTFEIISNGPEPLPLEFTVPDLISDYENVGWFVSVSGIISDQQANGFFLDDKGASVRIFVSGLTGIDLTDFQNGTNVTVQGACVVRNGDIQVWPRGQTDLFVPVVDIPQLTIVLPQGEPIPCDGTTVLNFNYTPAADTPAVKGYSVRVAAEGTAGVFSSADFVVNNLPQGEQVFYQIVDNGPNDCTVDYVILGSSTGGITTSGSLFSLTVHGAVEGSSTISVPEAVFRDLDNVNVVVDYSAQCAIMVDCGPPGSVMDASAFPEHEQITINWSDPADTDLASIEVYRGLWLSESLESAYPGYGQIPGNFQPTQFPTYEEYVASPEWELVGTPSLGSGAFVDSVIPRGIYFYQIFAVDHADNVGPPLAVSPVATNYILGDVASPYDGEVGIADLSMLGDSYGVGCGHQYYNGEVDIGPTADGSSHSIPIPDCSVGFEDLMIFSFNFGNSTPQKNTVAGSDELVLSWVQQSELEWSLVLAKPCLELKGLHLVAVGPGMQVAQVERGTLLSEQSGQVFLQKADSANLDIGLAVLGDGQGIEGAGELVRVTLTTSLATFSPTIEARNTSNGVMEFQLLDHEVQVIPTRFELGHNYPNPFNPITTISFSLPEAKQVKLAIYSLDGRHIRTLVSGLKPAGSYNVLWDGKDENGRGVSSGNYFYSISAGTFAVTRKMMLMK